MFNIIITSFDFDINLLSLPDFSDFDLNSYFSFKPLLPIQISKGCYWHNCAFCNFHNFCTNYVIFSEERILNLLNSYKKYGVFYFCFHDLTLSFQSINLFISSVLKEKFQGYYLAPIRFEKWLNKSLLDKMYSVGFRSLYFGLESGSQKIVNNMNKNFLLIDAKKILKSSYEAGISNGLFIILGYPTETKSTFIESLNFLNQVKNYVDSYVITKYLPLYMSNSLIEFKNKKGFYDNLGISKISDLRNKRFIYSDQQKFRGINVCNIFIKNSLFKKDKIGLIKINYSCNNNCLFCHSSDYTSKISLQKILLHILKAKQKGCDTILLSGGEPTLNKNLLNILKFIKANHLKSSIISNGRLFSYASFFNKHKNYIDEIYFSLHSSNEKTHDYLTATKNSFNETVIAIKKFVNMNKLVIVRFVITAINYFELTNFVKFMYQLGVKHIQLVYLDFEGNIMNNLKLIPNYSLIKKELLSSINIAEKLNINVDVENIPLCILDQYIDHRLKITFHYKYIGNDMSSEEILSGNNKLKLDKCSHCKFNLVCPGVHKKYIKTFGPLEFNSI